MTIPDDGYTEPEIHAETRRIYRRHYLLMAGGMLLTGLALIGYVGMAYTLYTQPDVLAKFVEYWPLGDGSKLMVWGFMGSQAFMMAAGFLWCFVNRKPDGQAAVYAAVKRLTDRGGL